MTCLRVLVLACSAVGAVHAMANNTYFTPGDAFFYCELEQSEWKELQNGKLTVLKYDRPEHLSFAFCGYSGFEKLDIAALPESYRKDLVTAIEKMKELFPTKVVEREDPKGGFFGAPPEKQKVEANKIRLFIYNRSFDFAKYRIALKYNESWPQWAKDHGYELRHFKFDFFLSPSHAIVDSWRFGSEVEPLALNLPEPHRGYVQTPIAIDPAKVKFLVAPPIELGELAYPDDASEQQCFVVSSDGVATLKVDSESRRPSPGWTKVGEKQ